MSETNIKRLGDFPFPISKGPDESRYLTWIRNHSNYMAVRGTLDYFRAIGVLLRGVLVNFLIFVPYLLGLSLVVAASNLLQVPPPFLFTKYLLTLVAAWILLFPLLMPLFRIVRYQKSRATGSDSSVKQRDRYERSFGAFLLAILVVAALESLPGLLDVFHKLVYSNNIGWPALASAVAATSAIFSIAPKLLSALGRGAARTLTLIAIAAVSVVAPLLFILFVSDFLVFGKGGDLTIWAMVASFVFPLGIVLAILLGLRSRAFKRKDILNIFLLFFLAGGLLAFGLYADKLVLESYVAEAETMRGDAIAELPKHAETLQKLAVDVAERPGPRVKKLIEAQEKFREDQADRRDFLNQRPMRSNTSLEELSMALKDYERKNQTTWDRISIALKRFLFSQQSVDPNPIEELYEHLHAYRKLRDDNAFYKKSPVEPDRKKLLEELLRELLDELANEARHVEGLSPVAKLGDTVDPFAKGRQFEKSAVLVSEVHHLYSRVTTLRDLHRPQSLSELAATLIIARDDGADEPYLALKELYEGEFALAEASLERWDVRLKLVHDELDSFASESANLAFLEFIEHVARQPGPMLEQLVKDLEKHRQNTNQQRYLFSRGPARPDQLEELLDRLAAVGYEAGLYPELGQLIDDIRTRKTADPEAMRGLHRLYSRATTLQDLDRPRPPKELVAELITLPKEDFEALCVSRYGLECYPEKDIGARCEKEFIPECRLLDFQKAQGVLKNLDGIGEIFKEARHELVATASLSQLDSEFYATLGAERIRVNAFWPKFFFVAMLAIELWFLCWLTVDVNLTSIHGLYRDRLASAFLVGEDTKGDIDIERDLNLMEICNHEAGSFAPYHLINVALNLQGSKDIGIRDRQSDFFIFSKRFIGGKRTGYCRSETMERVFPQMDLATAMAVSAAAASPNMGRGTSPALVAFMTLLNIRLGFWVPNPGLLENWLARIQGEHPSFVKNWLTRIRGKQEGKESKPGGFSFEEVFREELKEVQARWKQLPAKSSQRRLAPDKPYRSIKHSLVGIGYSGGGIRSATINLGITQALHERGVFDHVDYMSTVSGGGYLGSSISTLMRRKTPVRGSGQTPHAIAAGEDDDTQNSVGQLFHWRVRPAALVREIVSKLDETSRLVNVSDGGHIENLAGIELLRRRCKYVIIGDGEADPNHYFNGLATLIQTARIDLGVDITINADPLRLNEKGQCRAHWTIGRIRYPGEEERGYLLYLKSSVTGDEDEVIKQYRHNNPSFPHESTADQFFGEGQFEAYRSLGQHIGERVLEKDTGRGDLPKEETEEPKHAAAKTTTESEMSFTDLQDWFEALYQRAKNGTPTNKSV